MTRLPAGDAPLPVATPHFPDRLHLYVWRNWEFVPLERLAQVIGAQPADILRIGRALGFAEPPAVRDDQQQRSAITVIRRNWHLLPYEQLLGLLGWTEEQMAFALREDDFLYIKLGSLKPHCLPLTYHPADEPTLRRTREIAAIVRQELPGGLHDTGDPLFSFVDRLSRSIPAERAGHNGLFEPCFCSSYFALYGDPLLAEDADPYPDGYCSQLAACGVTGVWLHVVLHTLAPFPWDSRLSARHEERLQALRALAARVGRHGMGLYLYLNEPRAMPLAFYDVYPELRGATADDYAALCTSTPAVQRYIEDAMASVSRAVPDLAGFFTITASENLTNCWSYHHGETCPRCAQRTGAEVIAEVNGLIREGIREAGSHANLIVWDWGWPDQWAGEIIDRLPADVSVMSVSEWGIPITRGGVESSVGEYALSAIGPGPRATRHWALARRRGLKTIAKIQAGATWELGAVPYIPVLANVAQHASNLRACHVDGLMLGWTLGGYPSPNLEVVAAIGQSPDVTPEDALQEVARRRFGPVSAPLVVTAWHDFSTAFTQFPFHIQVLYHAPLHTGPANLLWDAPTGYTASMLGFPYDDLDGWRGVYPPSVFAAQLERVADGFELGIATLRRAVAEAADAYRQAVQEELNVAEAVAIHFRSTANQVRFVMARTALAAVRDAHAARSHVDELEQLLQAEIALARRLYAIQRRDPRIGFESSNQYFYAPLDLVEKVVNCRDLLARWLPAERARLV
jgi:hypothetical protein